MDRRSIIVVSVLGALIVAGITTGILLSSGSGSNSVSTPTSASTTVPTTAPASSTTSMPKIVSPATVPTTGPPTTVVIQPPSTSAATATPNRASDTGITAREIRVAVIADSAATAQGVQAWAAGVNQAGGLAGRTVQVDARLVASTADYAAAVSSACTTDFAVVGSSSQFDSQAGGLACGIPEVATQVFDATHRGLGTVFMAIPSKTGIVRVGAYRHLLSLGGCCRQYVLVPTAGPTRAATQAQVQGATAVGFTTAATPDVPDGATPADYAALVQDLVAKQATFANSGLGAASTVLLRQAAAANPGTHPVKWYCDERCATAAFLADGETAVERQNVDVGVNPLSDEHAIPSMAAYVREVKRFGPATLAGVESYSAGLLFERATRAVLTQNGLNGITRVRLLGALGGVHAFNAGGILGNTDVGSRQPTGCFALLRVHGGKLVRSFPAVARQLDCSAQNLQTITPGG